MKTPQFIIAIGASAGGLNQINTFFDFTPLDGVSYIVIQHLPSDYKSMMAQLLTKHSKLNILEAQNNMTVEANKVYLIPSKNVMTISDGKLLLTDKLSGVNLTIDTFFKSLAEERGDKSIGIILSGTGTDGTEGMKAIKNAGGMLIASDPKTSDYDQMPSSVIATGLVDSIVSPDEMPVVIEKYLSKRLGEPDAETDEQKDEKLFTAITNLIKDKLPEDFTGYKKATIVRRIKSRASLHNMNNLESYFNLLKTDVAELKILANDFLISVTSFFRDRDAFMVLEKKIFPALVELKQNEDIKIWIAGCATGEEAYSVAMLIQEELDNQQKNNTVKIFATDIDNAALQVAGKGFYSKGIEKEVSGERLEKFFTKEADGYRISTIIRGMLIFAHHDIIKNPPYCNMDFISCRNLLIYISPVLQKKILGMLHFGLRFGGYLFLGPSENVMDISSFMEETDKKWKIYKNIQAKRLINPDNFISPVFHNDKKYTRTFEVVKPERVKKADSLCDIDKDVLIKLGYSGVWTDEKNYVYQAFGNSNRYLLQKMFIHHLPDLLSKPLEIAFSTASAEADKTNALITIKGINSAEINSTVSLSVNPLSKSEDGEARRLVLFYDDHSVAEKQTIAFDEKFYKEKYTVNLEGELRIAKEELLKTNELLDASNENMQSFNEELLSANEEMQSTNEEMQSINEELQTINSEHQAKIHELSDLNDDLNNYFRSNVNGQVFVSKDLLLMKFSPGAATHINVLESDIGRPLSNISINIKFETIDKDIREVLLKGSVITKEIQGINGNWYQVMTMPYLRKGNNLRDGAIITFNDISELKKIQEELARGNKSLTSINADLDNFVYTASHDFLGPINNMEHIIYLIKEKEKALDNETNEYVGMLSTSVLRFKEVIKEMAVIGKIESEMFKVEPVKLDKMIGDIITSIQWKISSENASIQTLLEVNDIVFSKKNCRSILYNLINNAIKFKSHDRSPEILISTKELNEYIVLSVKDNGIGISKSKIAGIFKMYKRLNTEIEGQGLGLFLINKIIDAAGGKVEVESEPGEGTEFKLFIKK